jgi:5'-nucleotidase
MKAQILLTNDDGIRSPGLWAAAQALSALGFVQVVAPRDQSSGAGRSMPGTSDGIIRPQTVTVDGKEWLVYSVGGTPAQAVLSAVVEILPERPDLIVSGINYGENLGTSVTVSGTVGAALEGAALDIPALAVSLETDASHHFSLSEEVDFTAAAYFTALFAQQMLAGDLPPDVDALKIDIPCDASAETAWKMTRLSRRRYFEPVRCEGVALDQPHKVGYRAIDDPEQDDPQSDSYVVRVLRQVSVTPLSMDLTSRVDLELLKKTLHD